MFFKRSVLLVFFLVSGFTAHSQSKDAPWTVGVDVGIAKFKRIDAAFIGDQYILQTPRLNLSRYLFKGLSLDAGFGLNLINDIPNVFSNSVTYQSFDGLLRYDFEDSNESIVPYIALGGSLVKTTRRMTPTLNLGAGMTFWINDRLGIQSQLLYKHSLRSFESMRSHYYFSTGLVYSLRLRSSVLRLWQR